MVEADAVFGFATRSDSQPGLVRGLHRAEPIRRHGIFEKPSRARIDATVVVGSDPPVVLFLRVGERGLPHPTPDEGHVFGDPVLELLLQLSRFRVAPRRGFGRVPAQNIVPQEEVERGIDVALEIVHGGRDAGQGGDEGSPGHAGTNESLDVSGHAKRHVIVFQQPLIVVRQAEIGRKHGGIPGVEQELGGLSIDGAERPLQEGISCQLSDESFSKAEEGFGISQCCSHVT